jgi:aminopeptidase YwaD
MKLIQFRLSKENCLAGVILFLLSLQATGQTAWYYQWSLLPQKTTDYLIGAVSGEQAVNSVIDLSAFNRTRNDDEFSGLLFESEYVLNKLKSYGFANAEVEKVGKTTAWRPLEGVILEVSPHHDKLADIKDLPFVLVPGSPDTDSEGQLEYIGDAIGGTADKADLGGKFVLTGARPWTVMNQAARLGAAGIISYYSPRPLEDQNMIPDSKGGVSRRGKSSLPVFNISPREGTVLRDRLLHGEEIRIHVKVKSTTEEFEMQVPSAFIKGSDPDAGEIIISAHLFEGYGNQGANDNISGSAAILEVARVLNQAISEGKLAPPLRTIRFIWVPEYSGTIPWVNLHRDITAKALCNINLDMVGLSLSRYKSYMVLHRTGYGNAHYINDVMENLYRYVSETNQKNSVVSGSSFFKRIVAPSGTDDPFYYQIESSSGGSDHDVFNDWGVQVPGVLMITWPDPFYHSSQDRYDKTDPTQLKRVAFITAAGAYTVAAAGENEALSIAGEVYGAALRRIGYQVERAFSELNTSDSSHLVSVAGRCISNVRGTGLGEIMTLNSVRELAPGSKRLGEILDKYTNTIRALSVSNTDNLLQAAASRAPGFGFRSFSLPATDEEKSALLQVPVITSDPRSDGYEGYSKKLNSLDESLKSRFPVTGVADDMDAAGCIDGRNSILDIRDILNASNKNATDLKGLVNFFNRLREAGYIKINPVKSK